MPVMPVTPTIAEAVAAQIPDAAPAPAIRGRISMITSPGTEGRSDADCSQVVVCSTRVGYTRESRSMDAVFEMCRTHRPAQSTPLR